MSKRLPSLVRLFIVNGLLGFGISAIFVALLMWFDVMNLRHLVWNTADGPFALFVVWMLNGLLFGAIQIGYVVMTIGGDDRP